MEGGGWAGDVFDTALARAGGSVFFSQEIHHSHSSAGRSFEVPHKEEFVGRGPKGVLSFTESLSSSSLTSRSFFLSFEMRNTLSAKNSAN